MQSKADPTSFVIALIGAGQMGASVGGRMRAHGARVITELKGRSADSIQRAKDNGMLEAGMAEITAADIILSIVPPGEAMQVAGRIAASAQTQTAKPLFVDCNAISPETVRRIEDRMKAAGIAFQDAAIIGHPPGPGNEDGPVFYTSGEHNEKMNRLCDFGLIVKPIDRSVGSASALKMAFGGINKGITALSAVMALKARRMNAESSMCDELSELMPMLRARFDRSVPAMYPKAYRWVAEMREIASFLRDDPESAAIFEALANFYEKRAADHQLTAQSAREE